MPVILPVANLVAWYCKLSNSTEAHNLNCGSQTEQPYHRPRDYSLRLKLKRNDWLLADMCPQAPNQCALI